MFDLLALIHENDGGESGGRRGGVRRGGVQVRARGRVCE